MTDGPARTGDGLPALQRAWAGVVAGGLLAVLLLAAWLTPAVAGHGTHTQIGAPACPWAVGLGVPCPTCGMTTAFAHAADGRFVRAFLSQPLGFAMALGTAAMFWGAVHIAATGSQLGTVCARLVTPGMLWILAGAAAAAWAYKYATWAG